MVTMYILQQDLRSRNSGKHAIDVILTQGWLYLSISDILDISVRIIKQKVIESVHTFTSSICKLYLKIDPMYVACLARPRVHLV